MKFKKLTFVLFAAFAFSTSFSTVQAQSFNYSTASYLIEGSDGPKWLDVCQNSQGSSCSTPKSSQWRELSWAENIAYYTISAYESVF